MSAKFTLIPLSLALTLVALGCEAPDLPAMPAVTPVATEEPAPAAAEPQMDVGVNGTVVPPMEKPVTKTPRKFVITDPIQGRRSRDAGGYLGAVGNARFSAQFKIILTQIAESMAIYDANAGINGGWPKSHEEFMNEIIRPNGIQLPELDEPVEYIYVPEQHEKGLQIRLKPDFDGDVWPVGADPKDAVDDVPEPVEQPNQPNQPTAPPTDRAIGVEGAGAAAGVAPPDLQ